VGLGIHKESKATIEQARPKPGKGKDILIIILSTCGVLLVAAGIAVYCHMQRKKRI
jgi:flagellar basal body-associated protein FliL